MSLYVVHVEEHHGDSWVHVADSHENAEKLAKRSAISILLRGPSDEAELEQETLEELVSWCAEGGDYIRIYENLRLNE